MPPTAPDAIASGDAIPTGHSTPAGNSPDGVDVPEAPRGLGVIDDRRKQRVAERCMRFAVFVQCIGLGGRYLFSSHETESDVYGHLFFDRGWPESIAQRIDDWGAMACFLAGCLLFAIGLVRSSPASGERRTIDQVGRFLDVPAALVVCVWFLAIASCHMVRGEVYAELTLGEHAVRFAIPLALLCVSGRSPKYQTACVIAAIASAVTFAVHGYKAWKGYGPFIDLILLSDARFTHWEWSQSTAERALVVIGVVDIAVAVLLIACRWRWLAGYMVFWGLITSASRVTALGGAAWPEMLIRANNWAAPLVVWLILGWNARASGGVQSASSESD